jgi:integrase/recombinase XerD
MMRPSGNYGEWSVMSESDVPLSPVDALTAFHRYQQRRGYAASTRRAYNQFLEQFVVWAGGVGLDVVDARRIEFGWMEIWSTRFLEKWGREPSPRHVRNHLTALHVFFDFLNRFGYIEVNPMRRIDRPPILRRGPDWLTAEEDAALLGALVTPLERALVPLLRWTGMRGSEAEALQWRDLRAEGREIWVSTSKTPEGRRVIPVFDQLQPTLSVWYAYQEARGLAGEQSFVLATCSGQPLTHTQAWVTVKRVASRAGVRCRLPHEVRSLNLSSVSPHTLRRTFASDLLNRGVRLEVVSRLLGHCETRTTEASYARLLDSRICWEARSAYTPSRGEDQLHRDEVTPDGRRGRSL